MSALTEGRLSRPERIVAALSRAPDLDKTMQRAKVLGRFDFFAYDSQSLSGPR